MTLDESDVDHMGMVRFKRSRSAALTASKNLQFTQALSGPSWMPPQGPLTGPKKVDRGSVRCSLVGCHENQNLASRT
jgi:hypothetical protein